MKEAMVEGEERGRPTGQLGDLGSWTEQQAAEFELARTVIGTVIAAYSSRLARVANGDERDDLLAAQQRYVRERRLLGLEDEEQIKRILRDYPSLARRVAGQ